MSHILKSHFALIFHLEISQYVSFACFRMGGSLYTRRFKHSNMVVETPFRTKGMANRDWVRKSWVVGSSRLRDEESMAFSLMKKAIILFQIVFRIHYNIVILMSNRPPTSMTGAMGSELGRITFIFETLCSADCVLYFMVVSERMVFKGRFRNLEA